MKLWRADLDQLKPVLVDCPRGGWPNDDADGHKIFDNTHFATEVAAWDKLIAESSAGVSLAGSRVEECRQKLDHANVLAAQAAVEFARVREHHNAWTRQAQQPEDDPCDE